MKLLLCHKGYVGITIKNVKVRIDKVGTEERGYALVRDDIANELLKREGYEIVDPSTYPRNIRDLYSAARKTLGVERLEDLIDEDSRNTAGVGLSGEPASISDIPNPVFIPIVWTQTDAKNWPVSVSYSDSSGNANTFVFTQDFTLGACQWCRFKYWIRSKFRRNRSAREEK